MKSMSVFGAICLTTFVCGCGATPGQQLQADVNEMRKEHTPEKLVERGRAFASIGDYTRAEEYLTAALEAGAPPRKVMPMLLKVCISDNRFRSVIQHAEDYLNHYPDDVATRFVFGTVLYAIGEFVRARVELARVTTEQPQIADAHFALALADKELGFHSEAERQFREYLKLAPRGAHAAEANGGLMSTISGEASVQ